MSIRTWIPIAFLATSLIANADSPINVSGRAFTDSYRALDINAPQKPYLQNSGSLWLTLDGKFQEDYSFKATGQGNAFLDSVGAKSTFGGALREGYGEYHHAGIDLRVGRQIVPWGKTDAINPTDYLTAKDFTFLNADQEVRRIGTDSVWISLIPSQGSSNFNFTGIFSPYPPRSKILVPPQALPAGVVLENPENESFTLENADAAAKVSYNGDGWDVSASAFRGLSKTPEYGLDRVQGATAFIIPVYHPIHAFGGDFSSSPSDTPWVFRGEAAYFLTDNYDASDPTLQPNHLDFVLGVERPLPWNRDFRIILQFVEQYYSQIPNDPPSSDPINSGLRRTNSLLLGFRNAWNPGWMTRLSYESDDVKLTGEIFFLQNFDQGDSFLQPQLGWKWTGAFKTNLGLSWSSGPQESPLGIAKSYNSAFVEAKLLF